MPSEKNEIHPSAYGGKATHRHRIDSAKSGNRSRVQPKQP